MSKVVIKLSINHPNIKLIEVGEKDLNISLIKKNIGDSSGDSYMECVYKAWFEMPELVIICDESGMLKQYPIVMMSRFGAIAGDILICEWRHNEDMEPDLFGMSVEKSARVLTSIFPEGMNTVSIGAWN
ncbi:hypothetical protein H6G27_09960 [Nostoc linckia FACHB-104]|nr:hypothetical protein [Nostoc linckia FACHB-104]